MSKEKETVFTEMEKAMFTKDGNVKRYLDSNIVDKFENNQMATLNYPNGYGHGTRVHNESVALTTGQTPAVKRELRIRKITPKEALLLMGFSDEDYQALVDSGLSNAAIYHVAGDSIITTCLVGIISPLVNNDDTHINIINEYVERRIIQQ